MNTPNLHVETIPLADLIPYEGNAKQHPAEQVAQIAASIEEFGNCDPIGVWTNPKTGALVIVEGHGRYQALLALGRTEAPVIRLDHLTDEQRRAYTLVHNQTTLNSGWDVMALDMELDALDMDMEPFGFLPGADISDLFDPAPVHDSGNEASTASHEVECPECGHRFEP